MLGRKVFRNRCVVVMVAVALTMQCSTAFAGGRGWKKRRHHQRSVSIPPHYYVAPILGGLTFLYFHSLAAARKEPTCVVVPAPAQAVVVSPVTPRPAGAEVIVVNIPNVNGSYTQVTLRRSGGGYVGPQGEFYPANPTVEQLRVLYGK